LFGILFLLLAALSSVALADGKAGRSAPAASPAEHLLVVPKTAEGVVALARADARVVARYDSFALVEAAGEDDRRLRDAGAQRRDDMREVATAAGDFDPESDRASLAAKRAPDRDEVLALVQFVGPPKDAWVERLRATGAGIVTYQAENAYVVHAGGDAVERVAELVGADPAVRAVIPLGAGDKLEGRASGTARYAVSRVDGPGTRVGAQHIQHLELSATEVDRLARDPAVVAIERELPPRLTDERTSQIVAGNLNPFLAPSDPGYLAWYNARFPAPFTFAIDVTDSGIDDGTDTPVHPDFYELGSTSSPDRLNYQVNYSGDSVIRDCTGHGTNVASIAAGYNSGGGGANEDAEGFNYGLGVAPRAEIGSSKLFRCNGAAPGSFSPSTMASAAYTGDARISNNSWGSGTAFGWGSYTARSAEYDQLVRDAQAGTGANEQMVEVFAAGNDGDAIPGDENEGYGSISAEGSAKNVITVGASEGVRASGTDGCGTTNADANSAGDIVNFSSRGPTDDGRLKPDLVAPGTHVTGAQPPAGTPPFTGVCTASFATNYSLVSGTSQAAPQVAGAAALVRERFGPVLGSAPSPAMTKALLINTATDLAGGDNGKGATIAGGPNVDQGWGRVNLGSTFDSTTRQLYDQVSAFDASGEPADVRTFSVPDTSRPVKVTLVWTDAPGPFNGNAYVNNLDLDVGTGGQTYHGNVFGGAYSRSGGAADFRNNVESVYLPPGTSGRVSVTVRPTSINGNGVPGSGDGTDQDYALVVSNATEQAGPVLVHQATTIDDSGPGGDGDGALESDEQASLTEQVRNAGNADATGVSSALFGGAGVAVTQGTSGYPTIADNDGLAANSTPFGIHLANAAACGADAAATLAITSGSETQTVPVVLPTGAPGSLQSYSTASPVAIPDDNAAGVTSSVFVPDRGRVKDVNVSVAGITHTFVGDLEIEVTGPDGTTVRLADHPGGPNNGGDNLSGTVFDDEAAQNISQGTAPYTGNFKPQDDQLSRFDGISRRGTWTLRVRDLFEGDVGTLQGWGVSTQKALCNVDTTPPDTTIASAPPNPTSSTSAQFVFGSNDGGATFECRLDGAAFEPCPANMTFGGLALGTHTVSARAIDGSENEDPSPASYSWLIAPDAPDAPGAPTPAASFVLAPVEERLADALAGRYNVLAACATACRVSAKLGVSARTARRLDLSRKAYVVGSATKRRGSSGTAKLSVPLGRRARVALRGRALTNAMLTVTLTEGGSKLTLKRTVSLRRSAGLRRIANRGMRLWAACARPCPLSAKVTVSAAQARRLGLKPGKAKRYQLASRSTTATRTPKVLVLAVRRSARKALGKARSVAALLEAVAGAAPEPLRTAKLSTTLRR
jgi:subtilisin-like proprotein convertase family protein/subtilisin family serine protease